MPFQPQEANEKEVKKPKKRQEHPVFDPSHLLTENTNVEEEDDGKKDEESLEMDDGKEELQENGGNQIHGSNVNNVNNVNNEENELMGQRNKPTFFKQHAVKIGFTVLLIFGVIVFINSSKDIFF